MNNFNENTGINTELTFTEQKLRNKFFGIILATFSLCLVLTIGVAFGFSAFLSTEYGYQLFIDNSWKFLIAFLVLTILTTLIIWTLEKMKRIFLFLSVPVLVLHFGFSIGLGLVYMKSEMTEATSYAVYVILSLFVIPALAILVLGFLGYTQKVNLQKLKFVAWPLFIVFIVLAIISIFVFNYWLETVISVIGILLISFSIIVNFTVIRKKADNISFIGEKEIAREGIYYGIDMFILYAILVQYLLRIFSGNR
ncbi:MAG0110 family membrane protein [Mycoplasma buteonis]|uniref:MAG0110 family membrane protein n=1 Tax=Mycoplasma buteonis TaxID=171280 RepID=UPI0005622BF7|nr:Bax inhibitor-1 family protein [Mycoplasma buteonis]